MSLVKNVGTIGGLTAISRVFGFARDMLLARMLGAGLAADAFQLAFTLPNTFRRLFAEGAFSVAFVPMYSRALHSPADEGGGEEAADRFAGDVLSVFVWVLLAFSGLAMLGTFSDLLFNEEANGHVAEFIRNKISDVVKDSATAEALKPRGYPVFARRPCLDNTYYETFNLPHVHLVDLNTDPIVEITERGVRTQSGEIELDMILAAAWPGAERAEWLARNGDDPPAVGAELLHRCVADAAARAGQYQGPDIVARKRCIHGGNPTLPCASVRGRCFDASVSPRGTIYGVFV